MVIFCTSIQTSFFLVSRDGCVALTRGVMGLSAYFLIIFTYHFLYPLLTL